MSKKIQPSIDTVSYINCIVMLLLKNLFNYITLLFTHISFITFSFHWETPILPNWISLLQKKAICIMALSEFCKHSSPLFKKLGFLKLTELITLHNALIMFEFHAINALPSAFNKFFYLS